MNQDNSGLLTTSNTDGFEVKDPNGNWSVEKAASIVNRRLEEREAGGNTGIDHHHCTMKGLYTD